MIRLFRHYIPVQAVLLAVVEGLLFFLFVGAFIQAAELALGGAPANELKLGAGIAAAVLLVMMSLGMYSRETMCRVEPLLARASVTFPIAVVVICGTVAGYSVFLGSDVVPLKILASGVFVCGVIAVGVHGLFISVVAARRFDRRVLVVGTGEMAAKVAEAAREGSSAFTVAGFVECREAEVAEGLRPVYGLADLDTPEAALQFVRKHHVDEIVVATRERRGLPLPSLMECRFQGIPIRDFASFCEIERRHLDLDETQASSLIFNDGFRMSRGRILLKTAFDYLLAMLVLIATLPITIPVAIAIKLSSPGPIFFFQERVGQNGRVFKVIKFRSMRTDAEKDGPRWASRNDDRVTAVGRLIRKSRIDEIPQVINVLSGDMSFVGPRPERPFFIKSLRGAIPFYDVRHRVKPGITGWAQINYPYGASLEDSKHKHAYDLYYVKNGGVFLDLVIIFQTVRVVLLRSGAR